MWINKLFMYLKSYLCFRHYFGKSKINFRQLYSVFFGRYHDPQFLSTIKYSLLWTKKFEEIQNVTAIGVKTKLKRTETRIETRNNQIETWNNEWKLEIIKFKLEIIELKLKIIELKLELKKKIPNKKGN